MYARAVVAVYFAALAAAATANTNLQTTFPASSGTTNLAVVKTIAAGATFDGGTKQWDRSRKCFFKTITNNLTDGA
jgi:pectate lyase